MVEYDKRNDENLISEHCPKSERYESSGKLKGEFFYGRDMRKGNQRE